VPFGFLVGGPGLNPSCIGTPTGKAQRDIVVLSIGKLFWTGELTLEIVFSLLVHERDGRYCQLHFPVTFLCAFNNKKVEVK